MSEEKAVEKRVHSEPQVRFGAKGIELRDLNEAVRFAEGVVRANMAPKGMNAGGVVALIQAGQELGLPPMHSLSKLTFVNGRLGIMGDASMALVRERGVLAEGTDIEARWEGEGDAYRCVVTAKRRDASKAAERSYSVADAKRAGLWMKKARSGEPTPWVTDPDQMLMWRAWGRLSKQEFSDVLLGIAPAEEVRDYAAPGSAAPPERDVTPPSTPDPLLEAAASPEAPEEPEAPEAEPVEAEEVASEEGQGSFL